MFSKTRQWFDMTTRGLLQHDNLIERQRSTLHGPYSPRFVRQAQSSLSRACAGELYSCLAALLISTCYRIDNIQRVRAEAKRASALRRTHGSTLHASSSSSMSNALHDLKQDPYAESHFISNSYSRQHNFCSMESKATATSRCTATLVLRPGPSDPNSR